MCILIFKSGIFEPRRPRTLLRTPQSLNLLYAMGIYTYQYYHYYYLFLFINNSIIIIINKVIDCMCILIFKSDIFELRRLRSLVGTPQNVNLLYAMGIPRQALRRSASRRLHEGFTKASRRLHEKLHEGFSLNYT